MKKVTYSEIELLEMSMADLELLHKKASAWSFDSTYNVYIYWVPEEFYNSFCNED